LTNGLLAIVAASSSMAQVPEQTRAAIDRITGSRGTYFADERVYKVILPREAATIVQDYQILSPNNGMNSWVAFMPTIHHESLLRGQLLLLEDEADSVLTTALNAGLEVTGLADSSLFQGPRVKTLDVTGIGTNQDLAAAFRKALDEIRRVRADASPKVAKVALPELRLDSSIDPGPLNTILSVRGAVSEGVYKAAIGRRALIHGETIGREMGISTWIAFAGTDDQALAEGSSPRPPPSFKTSSKHFGPKTSRSRQFETIRPLNTPNIFLYVSGSKVRSVELARGLRYALDVQVGAFATERSVSDAE
jgi:hypothetical protein